MLAEDGVFLVVGASKGDACVAANVGFVVVVRQSWGLRGGENRAFFLRLLWTRSCATGCLVEEIAVCWLLLGCTRVRCQRLWDTHMASQNGSRSVTRVAPVSVEIHISCLELSVRAR